MLTYILFIVGFVLLIKGAGMLVDGSSSLARRFNVPSLVIGLTIVAFGTSAPEFIVNLTASFQGNTDIAIGNILGSNIANILLILGISALIYPVTAQKSTAWKEIPFSLLAALAVGALANDALIDGGSFSALSRIDGLILLGFFVVFLYYIASLAKAGKLEKEEEEKSFGVGKSIAYIILGLVALVIGGKWIVDGAVSVAQAMGISQSLIALTIVAVGTSLPELATSVVAAYKKESDIAIGNVVGSNIFNIFLILGTSSVIRPLPFSPESVVDILMTIGASAVLFSFLFIGKKMVVQRWQGAIMILIYVAYVVFLVMRG